MKNGAVPGTHSGYMSLCVRYHVPEDADLVLVRAAHVHAPPLFDNALSSRRCRGDDLSPCSVAHISSRAGIAYLPTPSDLPP